MATYRAIVNVAGSQNSQVITHSLNDVNAKLTACTPGGWPGRPYKTAQDANTITVTFGVASDPGGGTLDVEVNT